RATRRPRCRARTCGCRSPDYGARRTSAESAAVGAEDAEPAQPAPLQKEFRGRAEHAEPIPDAAPEIDRRGLWKIFRRAGDFTDAKPEIDALREHFVVEHEVV